MQNGTLTNAIEEKLATERKEEVVIELIVDIEDNMKSIATILCKMIGEMNRYTEEYDISNALVVLNQKNIDILEQIAGILE